MHNGRSNDAKMSKVNNVANNIVFGKRKNPMGAPRLAPNSRATSPSDPSSIAFKPLQPQAPGLAAVVPQHLTPAPNQPVSAPIERKVSLAARRKQVYEGEETRGDPRKKMLKGCKIIFNNRSSIFDGVIVDLSDTGAKLKVTNARYVANEFTLCAVQGDFEKICSVQWRDNDYIGVRFEEL